MDRRKPLDRFAAGVMLLLCLTWGIQQVAVKVTAPSISPVMQIAIRCALAGLMLLAVMRVRRVPLLGPPEHQRAGLLAGVLFASEFLFVAIGLDYTSASHMSVFIYTAPIFTALGLHWRVPAERLSPVQGLGVLAAFAGVAIAMSDGWRGGGGETYALMWLGDACGVLAGFLWGMTTVAIRLSAIAEAPPSRTLLYQLVCAAVGLYVFAVLTGVHEIGPMTGIAWASMTFQTVVVAFGTFLAWFWLLRRYLASRLAVFSFLTPVFGIAAGVLLLGEPFAPSFGVGALFILAGISLVNLPRRRPA
ncbi:DMT family transporter [Verticiella sediminum]|uniref:DMT family transporter n=1 Tax=Verticiella sediminum TaxID=1247510 RepID=A0A556AGY3_9BURK|nr:DMT family transporter [Verticiella sediminum]TSH92131.1 DMT family transporter [Verticiella sediminum]